MAPRRIMFFDGDCPFCNKSVEFVLKHNTDSSLKAAPLSGSTAKEVLPSALLTIDSLIYHTSERNYTYSSAAIRVLMLCGGLWKLMVVFLIIPKFLRDPIYKLIARNRRKIIRNACNVSSVPGLSERLLP